ncbi:hypothetical protein HBB16_09470 [Pseudonocardia sp. MCCB 268]|nr:hypothetical protein [Pseudonocardia cytotoxica]
MSTDDGCGGKARAALGPPYRVVSLRCCGSRQWLDLADRGQADSWVANWGAFLADPLSADDPAPCGHHRQSPDRGTTLRDYANGQIDPAAPASAQAVMAELAMSAPTSSAEVDTRALRRSTRTGRPARRTWQPGSRR